MRYNIAHALPPVIVEHIAAHNNHDAEALMATFAPDALVNDARREFIGHDAIRAWADKEIFGAKVTLRVERAYDQYGDIVVHARVDGDFDKTHLPDPLILSYYFGIRNRQITQLIVVLNSVHA
jgi:hypothetical protein